MNTCEGAMEHADYAKGVAVIVNGREVPCRPNLHDIGYPRAAS